jgi:hypothetical protein
MASRKKVKLFKNPLRNEDNDNPKQYVPQYKILGLNPEQSANSVLPPNTLVTTSSNIDLDNPRTRKPSIRQQYALPAESPVGRGQLPNVGNNLEQVWSSLDNEIIDDMSENIDPAHPMIDNNEVVTWQDITQQEPTKPFMTEKDLRNVMDLTNALSILKDIKDNEYVLIVKGEIICSGSEKEVEEQTKQFIFGEHELCQGSPVSIDDIVVLKKIKIKMGVFLS